MSLYIIFQKNKIKKIMHVIFFFSKKKKSCFLKNFPKKKKKTKAFPNNKFTFGPVFVKPYSHVLRVVV